MMTSKSVHTCRWILMSSLFLVGSTQGAKILLLTSQIYSHCLEIGSVGQELARRGHDVAVFLDVRFNHKNCYQRGYNGTNRIRPILFQPDVGIKKFDDLQDNITKFFHRGEEPSPLTRIRLLGELTWHMCAAIFSDRTALELLKEEHFDFAIVNGMFFSYCLFVIPYKLDMQYAAFGTIMEDLVTTRPSLSGIVPGIMTRYTNKMTFIQRLGNWIGPFLFHAVIQWNIPMDVIARFAPELSAQDVINIVSKSELFLYNHDMVLSYTIPRMPNHIFVGGVAAQPAVPLSGVFSDIYHEADDGVVMVSLGSTTIGNAMSSVVTDKLKTALKKLNIDVVWKDTGNDDNSKVKRVKWLPQNDLLGHPKTRLFVSHCGNNGVFEALYHGVPLVCTPIFGDQFYNGNRVEKWNVGITVPLVLSSEETLFNAINEVLHNSTYKTNMMKASKIYHSRPENPRERAAFWIEHVLEFGGDHLQSPASDMSAFTYLGYDIFCVVLICVLLILLSVMKTSLLLYNFCCHRRAIKSKTN